jgi:hypothetical protein
MDEVKKITLNNHRKGQKITAVMVLMLIASLFVALEFVFSQYKNWFNKPVSLVETNSSQAELHKGWKAYKNNVLGIKFSYPQHWGDVQLSPSQYLTNLKTINNNCDKNDSYGICDTVTITFSTNSQIKMEFINDSFMGRKYPNSQAQDLGYIDNFSQLKLSKNICDYKIEFDKRPSFDGVYKEIVNLCESGVKTTALMESFNFSTNPVFNGYINQYAFQKTQNGYYDNLLVTNLAAQFSTQDNLTLEMLSYNTAENQNKIQKIFREKLSGDQNASDFVDFVKGISSFKPIKTTIVGFESIPNENFDITLLRKYYYYLSINNLNEAYNLQTKFSQKDFNDTYQNVILARPYNFKKTGDHVYQFNIDLQDDNQPEIKYLITSKVINEKIINLSVDKITSPDAVFDNMVSYTKISGNKSMVVLKKGDNEKTIAQIDLISSNNPSNTVFLDPHFSPLGNYLVYDVAAWEYHAQQIYSIKYGKTLNQSFIFPNLLIFTNDEKKLVYCGGGGMAGEINTNLYSGDNFSNETKILDSSEFEGIFDIKCSFDAGQNIVTINLFGDSQEKTLKYDLNKQKMIGN